MLHDDSKQRRFLWNWEDEWNLLQAALCKQRGNETDDATDDQKERRSSKIMIRNNSKKNKSDHHGRDEKSKLESYGNSIDCFKFF